MPDLVDCVRLAANDGVLERHYELRRLPRLRDRLTDPGGSVQARFGFERLSPGRVGARVTVTGIAPLQCQRCLCRFSFALHGDTEIEFREEPDATDSQREIFKIQGGLVSLRELAEEEALLALPVAPACDTPSTCGNAPDFESGGASAGRMEMPRPFGSLQDLLKKT